MLISYKLIDLDNVGDSGSAARALASSLLANAESLVIYHQESDQLGATADALALTRTEQSLLPILRTVGVCGASRTDPSSFGTSFTEPSSSIPRQCGWPKVVRPASIHLPGSQRLVSAV